MGMCAMYSFCKYGERPLRSSHELQYGEGDDDSPRSGTSSDGTVMLRTTTRRGTNGGDQQSALWKRAIPKGRRCEPLEFSGLILYDEHGNRLHPFTPSERSSLAA